MENFWKKKCLWFFTMLAVHHFKKLLLTFLSCVWTWSFLFFFFILLSLCWILPSLIWCLLHRKYSKLRNPRGKELTERRPYNSFEGTIPYFYVFIYQETYATLFLNKFFSLKNLDWQPENSCSGIIFKL